MKELKLWQKVGVVAVFAFVAFSVSFSTYQLFFDKADAGVLFHCDGGDSCSSPKQKCGSYNTCVCVGGELFSNCLPGVIVPEQ